MLCLPDAYFRALGSNSGKLFSFQSDHSTTLLSYFYSYAGELLCWQLFLFKFFARSTVFIPGNDKILGWELLQASVLLRIRVTCSDFLHPHVLNHEELWINEASALK